jgi:hypothetical protein
MLLGGKIRQLRSDRGWSQRELAARLGGIRASRSGAAVCSCLSRGCPVTSGAAGARGCCG